VTGPKELSRSLGRNKKKIEAIFSHRRYAKVKVFWEARQFLSSSGKVLKEVVFWLESNFSNFECWGSYWKLLLHGYCRSICKYKQFCWK